MTLALGQLGIALCVLLIPVGLVALVQGSLERARKRERPRPDYAAIAAMEREVYGEAFEHEGAPKPVRTVSGPHGLPAAAQACWHCGDRARIRGLCLPCSKMLKGWGIEPQRTICPQGHPDRRWVEGRGEVCPTCDDARNARSNLRWN